MYRPVQPLLASPKLLNFFSHHTNKAMVVTSPRRVLRPSATKLRPGDACHFDEVSVFGAVAGAVCDSGVVTRKEFFENWECAQKVHSLFFEREEAAPKVVVDVACGHGLLSWMLLALCWASSHERTLAFAVDKSRPPSASTLRDAFSRRFPSLRAYHTYVTARVPEELQIPEGALVVALHACGPLTDDVLRAAADANAAVVCVPCCHSRSSLPPHFTGDLANTLDQHRELYLRDKGYDVSRDTRFLDPKVTPKNAAIIGRPPPRHHPFLREPSLICRPLLPPPPAIWQGQVVEEAQS